MNKPILPFLGLLFVCSFHAFSQSSMAKIEAILEQKFKNVVNRCHDPNTYFFEVLNTIDIAEIKDSKAFRVSGDYTFLCGKDTYYNKFKASLKKYQDTFVVTEIKTTNSKKLSEYWVVYPKHAQTRRPNNY